MGRKKKLPLERKYFGMLPHCIWQVGLPPLAILVYMYIKKRSGEHGYCSESTVNMAKNIGISEGSVSNAKA